MKIFSEVLNYRKEVLQFALGEFGISLFNFSNNIDQKHLDIFEIPISEELSDKLIKILKITNYAFDNNLLEGIDGIDKLCKKKIPIELSNIDKKFVRFAKDIKYRENLRNKKKIYEISLLKFYEKANVIWQNLPSDFSIYKRYNTRHNHLISEAESKAKRYENLGCEELYRDIVKSIEDIKKNMNDTHHGYHRISLKNASIILSKINGFKLEKEYPSLPDSKYVISINKNIYNPKAYPIRYFYDIFTFEIEKLFTELEKVPLFDYYMVLVPSIQNYTLEKDIKDVENKNTIPVLLGEKDGKCYFISYWI